ncbi:MAG: hypothetical protein IK038_10920 [Bacteroidaceae bacterium]|nr:hypothetical protein [Bacteroidaceae bacterium]
MNTIPFVSDSISAHLSEVAESCSNCVHAANTNWADVRIAHMICFTIIMIVLIVALIFAVVHILQLIISFCHEKKRFVMNDDIQTNELCRSLYKKSFEQYIADKAVLEYKSPSQKAKDLLDDINNLTNEKDGLSKSEYVNGLKKLKSDIESIIKKTEDKQTEREKQPQNKKNEEAVGSKK